MGTRVEMRGFDELERKLAKLATSLPEARQQKILSDAGEIVAEEARMLAPVRFGNLRDSIAVSTEVLGGAFKMDGGLSLGSLQVLIGPSKGGNPDGFYGHFVEFGTVSMPAQPFMRPAFDHTEGQLRSRIAGDVRSAVRKAVR